MFLSAWEKVTVELTSLVFGVPFLLLPKSGLGQRSLSPIAFSRLRFLWSYLRSSLPEPFAAPALMRCKKAEDFFEALGTVWDETDHAPLDIAHQPGWDSHFAGQRG